MAHRLGDHHPPTGRGSVHSDVVVQVVMGLASVVLGTWALAIAIGSPVLPSVLVALVLAAAAIAVRARVR